MRRPLRSRLTYANVMSTMAVFIALGGSSYAAVTLNGKDIKHRSIPGSKLKRNSVTGLEIRESRPRVEGEGHSLYFYDDDNHLFELHTGTLEERLDRYRQGPTR